MAQRKIRIGIVGAGRIAEFVHMPSLQLCSSECEVIAVAGRERRWIDLRALTQ